MFRSFANVLSIATAVTFLAITLSSSSLLADGKVMAKRDYKGSLEELSQEAIIIFQASGVPGKAREDLILKISVKSDQELDQFAWIIPLPNVPEIKEEDSRLFVELFAYVEARRWQQRWEIGAKSDGSKGSDAKKSAKEAIEVLTRRVVGKFETAVVRVNEKGALNKWLEEEGFQTLPNAEDVIDYYRKKRYVFACIKVSDVELTNHKKVGLHPLRFSFETGGRDGIYFPMKMTGLQSEPFDITLYVFDRYWINKDLNKYGFEHQGFRLLYRDWDAPQDVPDGGKNYSNPINDPFLNGFVNKLSHVSKLFADLDPDKKFYLTKIQADQLNPTDVRAGDDLWLFPHYTDVDRVPYDIQDGTAAGYWPEVESNSAKPDPTLMWTGVGFGVVMLALLGYLFFSRQNDMASD